MARLRLRSTPVGDVLLIHPKGRYDDRAAAFASGIAEDPLHTLVVVDLPADALVTEWEGVARLLSSPRHGSPRLVFGRGTGDDIRTACRLLAERLEREVLAPDGDLVPTVTGGLFVPGDDGAAWLRFRPGRDPEPEAQRYPKPHWEFTAPTRTGPAGAHTVAQPVPAGVWLRHTDHDPMAARHHRAVETVPTDPHLFLLVLGSPGTPPLALDDVAQFWDTVLPGVRPAARFVLHGSLDTPAGQEPGQTLADVLNHQVTLYDALPYAEPEGGPSRPSPPTCPPRHTRRGSHRGRRRSENPPPVCRSRRSRRPFARSRRRRAARADRHQRSPRGPHQPLRLRRLRRHGSLRGAHRPQRRRAAPACPGAHRQRRGRSGRSPHDPQHPPYQGPQDPGPGTSDRPRTSTRHGIRAAANASPSSDPDPG